MNKGKSRALPWIYGVLSRFLPQIILISLLNILISVLLVLTAWFSKQVLELFAQKSVTQAVMCVIALFSVLILETVGNIIVSVMNAKVSGKMTIELRRHMFSSVIHKKYSSVFAHHSGDLLNRFTSDINEVVLGAVSIIPGISSMLAKIAVGIGALMLENYIFAIAVLLFGFAFPLFGRILSKKYKFMHKEVLRTEGQSRSFLQECFANIVVVKTFAGERSVLGKLDEYMAENYKLKMKRNAVTVLMNAALHAFFSFGYYALLVWGALSIAAGMSYGLLTYYLQLVSILRAPLQNISGILPRYYSMMASAERLMDLDNIEEEQPALSGAELEKLKSEFKEIVVDNIAFIYDDGEETVLNECSFTVKKNELTAVIGSSGSGKSTLFKLLLGLYEPTKGQITFGGEIPVNAATRSMFSYVPQNSMILSGTIRENLTFGNVDISEDKINSALKAAVLYDAVGALPKGIDTVLSERGAGLSEGQLQRLAIARALLFDAPILLLDESTSALDEVAERQLLSNIKKMTDKTVILITHKKTSAATCDTVINFTNKPENNAK